MNTPTLLRTTFIGLILAFVWAALTGDYSLGNFSFGFLVGLFIRFLLPERQPPPAGQTETRNLPKSPIKWLRFTGYFVYTLVVSNYEMAKAVILGFYGLDHLKPAIVAIPLDLKRATEITLLANWITLTPGTLTLDVTPEGDRLFVHTYYLGESPEAFVAEIKKLERQVQELFS